MACGMACGMACKKRVVLSSSLVLCMIVGILSVLTGCGGQNEVNVSESLVSGSGSNNVLSGHVGDLQFVSIKKRPFYTENGTDYYGVERLLDDENDYFTLDPIYSCFDENSFYEIDIGKSLTKYSLQGLKISSVMLVDLQNPPDSYFVGKIAAMSHPISYGDDIYFYAGYGSYSRDPEGIIGSIGKVNKLSGNVELVGDPDITACAFAIRDGWIYYLDIDYQRAGNKAGVYKMKTDGSQKTLLRPEEDMSSVSDAALILNGEYIYYAYTASVGKTDICRIKADGSGYELLAEAFGFRSMCIDNDQLYYVSHDSIGSGINLNVIDTRTKQLSRDVAPGFVGDSYIDIDDGYLYCLHYSLQAKGYETFVKSTDPAEPDKYWVRYNINEGFKPEYFYAYKTEEGYVKGSFKDY